jgi:pyridoxine/pyridoxamine 5'-phosphate oxidase
MINRVYKQKFSINQFKIKTDNPLSFFQEVFEREAKQQMNKVTGMFWVPVLDDQRHLIEYEFIAHGYNYDN